MLKLFRANARHGQKSAVEIESSNSFSFVFSLGVRISDQSIRDFVSKEYAECLEFGVSLRMFIRHVSTLYHRLMNR